MSLHDLAFLVTGASGGVGHPLVERLLAGGGRVAALDRAPYGGSSPGLTSIVADLADEGAVEKAFDTAERAIGPLWGVLHIAGGWQGGAPVRDTGLDVFDRMLTMNLRTSFLIGRAAMRRLTPRGGRIAMVGSWTAATFTGLSGSGAYNVSKAGVIALVKVLAEEGREARVLVNAVAPNTIATAANRAAMPDADASRWVPIEAVVESLVSLVSPCSAVSGAVLTLPGR